MQNNLENSQPGPGQKEEKIYPWQKAKVKAREVSSGMLKCKIRRLFLQVIQRSSMQVLPSMTHQKFRYAALFQRFLQGRISLGRNPGIPSGLGTVLATSGLWRPGLTPAGGRP